MICLLPNYHRAQPLENRIRFLQKRRLPERIPGYLPSFRLWQRPAGYMLSLPKHRQRRARETTSGYLPSFRLWPSQGCGMFFMQKQHGRNLYQSHRCQHPGTAQAEGAAGGWQPGRPQHTEIGNANGSCVKTTSFLSFYRYF